MTVQTIAPMRSAPRITRDDIIGIDQQVPLLDGTFRTYAYLDNAASTPALRRVQDTVNEFLLWYSSVHRGAGFKSLLSTRAYKQAREIVTQFLGADPEHDSRSQRRLSFPHIQVPGNGYIGPARRGDQLLRKVSRQPYAPMVYDLFGHI